MTSPSDPTAEETPRAEAKKAAQESEIVSVRKLWFAFTNVIAGIVSILASVVSIVTFARVEATAPHLIAKVHWIVFMAGFVALYAGISYVITKLAKADGVLAIIFRIPSWVELRNFGDQRIARISYVALALIPLVAFIIVENPLSWEWLRSMKLPLNLKISFFIAFFLSLALISFAVGCPKEFHRRKPFEGAKNVNVVLTSVSRTKIAFEEPNEFYNVRLDNSKIEIRAVCWLFYALGLAFSLILLFRIALFILYA